MMVVDSGDKTQGPKGSKTEEALQVASPFEDKPDTLELEDDLWNFEGISKELEIIRHVSAQNKQLEAAKAEFIERINQLTLLPEPLREDYKSSFATKLNPIEIASNSVEKIRQLVFAFTDPEGVYKFPPFKDPVWITFLENYKTNRWGDQYLNIFLITYLDGNCLLSGNLQEMSEALIQQLSEDAKQEGNDTDEFVMLRNRRTSDYVKLFAQAKTPVSPASLLSLLNTKSGYSEADSLHAIDIVLQSLKLIDLHTIETTIELFEKLVTISMPSINTRLYVQRGIFRIYLWLKENHVELTQLPSLELSMLDKFNNPLSLITHSNAEQTEDSVLNNRRITPRDIAQYVKALVERAASINTRALSSLAFNSLLNKQGGANYQHYHAESFWNEYLNFEDQEQISSAQVEGFIYLCKQNIVIIRDLNQDNRIEYCRRVHQEGRLTEIPLKISYPYIIQEGNLQDLLSIINSRDLVIHLFDSRGERFIREIFSEESINGNESEGVKALYLAMLKQALGQYPHILEVIPHYPEIVFSNEISETDPVKEILRLNMIKTDYQGRDGLLPEFLIPGYISRSNQVLDDLMLLDEPPYGPIRLLIITLKSYGFEHANASEWLTQNG